LRTAEKPGAASFRYTEIPTSTSAGSRTAVDEDEDDDGVGGDRFDAAIMVADIDINGFQRSARVLLNASARRTEGCSHYTISSHHLHIKPNTTTIVEVRSLIVTSSPILSVSHSPSDRNHSEAWTRLVQPLTTPNRRASAMMERRREHYLQLRSNQRKSRRRSSFRRQDTTMTVVGGCLLALWSAATAAVLVSSFAPPHWVAVSPRAGGGSGKSLAVGGFQSRLDAAAAAATNGIYRGADPVPFLVERIDDTMLPRNSALYNEIAEMCIEAFFNDDEEGRSARKDPPHKTHRSSSSFFKRAFQTSPSSALQPAVSSARLPLPKLSSPTKSLQLAYLRNLQAGDLRRRREREAQSNMMFVARRLVPISDSLGTAGARPLEGDGYAPLYLTSPLVLDFSNAYNLRNHRTINGDDSSSSNNRAADTDYVRGEILGFVEVTNRRFGLGVMPPPTSVLVQHSSGNDSISNYLADQTRAVLTNLSVRRDVRQFGVGSKLLDFCEEHVASEWGGAEVVLEVEDDNARAKDFYRKRGYQVVYADGTARRYDLSGLWLREVRCRRLIMRKCLVPESAAEIAVQNTVNFGIKVLQAIKDNVFSTVA
jgi:ribosomal protein S18 acetylase RimI-like enzyme